MTKHEFDAWIAGMIAMLDADNARLSRDMEKAKADWDAQKAVVALCDFFHDYKRAAL